MPDAGQVTSLHTTCLCNPTVKGICGRSRFMSAPTTLGPGRRVISRTSKRETTTLRAGLIATCAVALAFLSWVSVLSYRSMPRVEEDQRWGLHTYLVLQKLDGVLVRLISAGTSQCGYVFTGEESYLSSCKADLDKIRDDLNDVGQLTKNSPQQQPALRQLRPLISTMLSEFQEEPTLGSKKGMKTDAAVRGGMKQRSLLEIMSRVTQMKKVESRLLIQRSKTAQAGSGG